MRLQPGAMIGGRYRLTEPIASGGMGTVWKAEDTTLGRRVAIKLLKPELSGDPTFLARFRAEARHSGRLNHPNIAAVYDYGETPGTSGLLHAYLVMELVPGEPMSQILADEPRLPSDRVLKLVRQVGSGLAAAHAAGIIHRDIKPGNLIVTPDGQVKITDFGISRAVNAVPLTATGTVMGTARYISPEQATGETPSPASDIYALGVVAYEALAGRPPFDAEGQVAQAMAHVHDEPRPLPADVPAPVRELVMRMLAKSPAARPADGAALVLEVDAAARGESAVDATALMGTTGATRVLPGDLESTQVMPGDLGSTQVMPGAGRTGPVVSRPTPRPTPAPPAATVYPDSGTQPAAGGGGGAPRRKRRSWTLPLIVLILLVAFVAAGAAFSNLFRGGGESPTPAPTTVTETQTVTPTTESSTTTEPSQTETSTSTTSSSSSSSRPSTTSEEPSETTTTSESTTSDSGSDTQPQNEGAAPQGEASQGDAAGEGGD